MNTSHVNKGEYRAKFRGMAIVLLALMLASLLLITSAPESDAAKTGECGDDLIWSLTENGGAAGTFTLTISGDGKVMTDYSSTSLPEWNEQKDSITKLELPVGITHIGNYAFYGLSSLTSTNISKLSSLESIGDYAFSGTGIGSLNLIPTKVVEIGEGVFSNCDGLTTLTFGLSKITAIGKDAFANCEKMTSIAVPNAKTIGKCAFAGCTFLNSFYGKSVVDVGDNAFDGCSAMTSFTGNSVTTIGNLAFKGCSSLTSLDAPNAATIKGDAFTGCSALTDVKIGDFDDLSLFEDATSLKYISISGSYHPIIDGVISDYNDDNAAFKIGTDYYPNIMTAQNEISDGDTLIMLDNQTITTKISLGIESGTITFDLGGNELTLAMGEDEDVGIALYSCTIKNGAITDQHDDDSKTFTAIDVLTGHDVEIVDVKITINGTGSESNFNNVAIRTNVASTLTISGESLIQSESSSEKHGSVGVVLLGNGNPETETRLYLTDTATINVGQYGISGNGTVASADDSTDYGATSIEISGNSKVSATCGWGIYHPQDGTLKLTDEAKISGLTGVEMRSGTLIVDGAEITASEYYSTNPNIRASSVYGAAIAVAPYGDADERGAVTVNIIDGSFKGGVALAQFKSDYVTDPGFDFSIAGGTFKSTGIYDTDKTYPAIVTVDNEAEQKFVTGGTFKSGDTADITVEDYVKDNYRLDTNGSGTVNIVDPSKAVAVVGDTYLTTIEEVIYYAAAKDGCTVKFLKDVELDTQWVISNTVTIDLNDRTITNRVSSGSMILVEDGASLTIKDEGTDKTKVGTISDSYANRTIVSENGSTVVIESGYFYKKADSGAILASNGDLTVNGGHFNFETNLDNANGYAIRVTNGGDAVINDVLIESQKAGILVRGSDIEGVYPDSSTTLIVYDATIKSSYYAFAVWGYGYENEDDNDNVVLTVKNADVTVRNEKQLNNTESAAFGTCAEGGAYAGHTINIEGGTYTSNTGCYFPSYGEYNISGGTFDSSMYGIRICAGELTISGSASINVNAEGTATLLVPVDGKTDRPTGTMGPLTIGKQTSTGYPGDIVVKIEGGTLTNNTEGGNAITVYDDNLASSAYKDQTISVNVSGGTVTGDVEYVHSEDSSPDSKEVSYEMTGGTVDGDIVADKTVYSDRISIESGKVTGTVDEDFLGNGMIIDDSGEVVPNPDKIFDISSEDFFNLAEKDSDGSLVFDLDRNYHITDSNGRLTFSQMTDQSYTGIVINGNGHTLYGALSFDATYNDGDTQSYSVTINDLNLDGSKASDYNWNYGISVQNQSPAETDHSPRPIDFTMIGGSVSNYGSKGIYITTATSVTIDGVDVVNCAYDLHFNDEANDVFYYYTRGDYAIDIDITGVTCTAIDISDVTFSGETGAVASLKIAQRGGAGDDPGTWGEATIGTITLSGLDFTDSNAPTDIILGSEPYTSSDDTAEDETRDYNSAFDVNLTAQGETSLSVWGADRQPSNGNNLRLDLTNGSVVSTTGQKDDENGSIGIELVSGSARVSGQLLPSMYLTADEDSVTFGDFEDISGGNLELIAPEPNPPFNPGWADDDDDVVIPPTIVVDDSSSSDDDEAVKIAACAAAAVAAAIIALFLIATYRKN